MTMSFVSLSMFLEEGLKLTTMGSFTNVWEYYSSDKA